MLRAHWKVLVLLSSTLFGRALADTTNADAKQPGIKIVVSVDWEGRELNPDNLEVMKTFRKDYPEIPLQMFLNAAYYTKAGADANAVTTAIKSTLLPIDEHGLHIHAWKSLMEASGVKFRVEPAFKGPLDLKACTPDCGHDVNLTAYTEKELRKVIRFSNDTLVKNGFQRPVSFRAGAWQADKKVLSALAREGFTLDSSATDAEYLKVRWGKFLLYPVVKKIWPETVASSQPYIIPLKGDVSIWELPNNGNLADYVTGEQILEAFRANLKKFRDDPSRDVYLSIGFHQETAAKFLNNLRSGIDLIKADAIREKVSIEFVVPPLDLPKLENK